MTPEIRQRIEQIRRGEVPEGYKHTRYGIYPVNWTVKSVGECIEEYKELSNDIQSFEVYSSSRRGLLPQSEYYAQKEAEETNLGYKVVPHGYVTYRHMSDDDVFHFNVNHTGSSILVSSEYPVFTSSNETSLDFLIPALNYTGRFRYFCRTQKLGGTRTRLYLKNLSQYHLGVPCFEEQQKIAAILTAQDKVIELKEKRLAEKQRQKKHLMQQLLTGKKRLLGFIKKWRAFDFDKIFITISTREHQINKTEYETKGSYPVIDQGKQMIAAYSNNAEKVLRCPKDGIIVFGDHTREIKFVDFDFIAGADGTQLLSVKSKSAITKYLFYYLSNKEIHSDGYSRHFKYVKEFVYRLPSLEEQTAIAEVLSAADREIDLLRQDIEQEKQKKKALMQLLLTGIVRVVSE